MPQVIIPSSAEMCSVVAKIDLKETRDSSAKSHFHWKTLKCRVILDTMRDSVIACPSCRILDSINLITSAEFFKSQIFQNNLRELNITWSSPRPVTPDVYADCLRYSILFAIAPRWNKVGQYLVAGKHFLTNSRDNESSLAIRLKLTLPATNEMTMNLEIEPLKIKQPYVSLEEIAIPHEVIAHFMADPEGKIDVTYFGIHRVIVLPSLKRGKLMAVLKSIPASSPFKNYGELRRHWKNMYGYRLPKSDVGMIYYEVYFAMPSAHCFLYPHVCVRSRLIETPYLGNRETLVRSFLADMSEMVPTICDQPFKILTKSHDVGNSTISSSSSPENFTGIDEITGKENFYENSDETARLSFSDHCSTQYQSQLLRRDLSTAMSPTPSLRGNFSGILVASAATRKVRDRKSLPLRLCATATADDRPESENHCPNDSTNERSKAEERKTTAMELESAWDESLPRIFMPISSFSTSSPSTNEVSQIFQKISPPAVETGNKAKITNPDVESKYFAMQGGSNTAGGKNQSVSEGWKKTRMLQKLLNNLKPNK